MTRFRQWWSDEDPIWKSIYFLSAYLFVAGFVGSGLLTLRGTGRVVGFVVFGCVSAIAFGVVIWLLARRR